jgi:hypothetical protein
VDKPKPLTNHGFGRFKDSKAFQAFLARAQTGDKSVLPELQDCLTDPRMVDILGGDLALEARRALIDTMTKQNLLVRESLTRKLELLYAELAGQSPTPLERLLADRIVTCWLHLHCLEQNYFRRESVTLEIAAYFQRCISSAQKRYLAAIKMLAVVRKLAVPVLQVNIAKKQVNIAGPAVIEEGEKSRPDSKQNQLHAGAASQG